MIAHPTSPGYQRKVPVRRPKLADHEAFIEQILGDGMRKRSHLFASLQCHYAFVDRYWRPAKGNDKGAAEGMVGFTRRTLMVPIPQARGH